MGKPNVNLSEDNELTNFREIRMGRIPGGLLYRGSYPIMSLDPERDKAYDRLVSEARIECVINLADNESGLETTANSVHRYSELLKNNKIYIFRKELKNRVLLSKKITGLPVDFYIKTLVCGKSDEFPTILVKVQGNLYFKPKLVELSIHGEVLPVSKTGNLSLPEDTLQIIKTFIMIYQVFFIFLSEGFCCRKDFNNSPYAKLRF